MVESARGAGTMLKADVDFATLASALAERCAADGEFTLAARYWDGSLSIGIGGHSLDFVIVNGSIAASLPDHGSGPAISLRAPETVWSKLLAATPPPMFNDIMPAAASGLVRDGDEETFWQYYPAVRRLVDLLREEVSRARAI